jgi:hypothetical protein
MGKRHMNYFKKEYFIFPVGEWYDMFDKKYQDWGFGRIEVRKEDEYYSIDEWRYVCPPESYEQLNRFFNWLGLRNLNKIELQIIKLLVIMLWQKPPK